MRICDRYIDATKKEPGGRVEPLPEVKPYEAFTYTDRTCARRSCPAARPMPAPDCAPTAQRNREFLEQYSLDTLKMVGTLSLGGQITTAWCRPRTGVVHRVVVGEHIGTNDGKITDITAFKDRIA